jgi:putative membrane protein
MLSSLNQLTSAYGTMEVIRLVPIPVAHLIHHKQTLALFCGILPFAMASEMDWWAVPLVAFVAFTLYGIEGIAQTYEDPFGVAKIDINLDDIVEDARREVEVMLYAWQIQGGRGGIFRPHAPGDDAPTSDASSDYFSHGAAASSTTTPTNTAAQRQESLLRVVVNDLNQEIQRETSRRRRERARASGAETPQDFSTRDSEAAAGPSNNVPGPGAGGKKLSWHDGGGGV